MNSDLKVASYKVIGLTKTTTLTHTIDNRPPFKDSKT